MICCSLPLSLPVTAVYQMTSGPQVGADVQLPLEVLGYDGPKEAEGLCSVNGGVTHGDYNPQSAPLSLEHCAPSCSIRTRSPGDQSPTCRRIHPHQRWAQWGWCHPRTSGAWQTDDCRGERTQSWGNLELMVQESETYFPRFTCLLSDTKTAERGLDMLVAVCENVSWSYWSLIHVSSLLVYVMNFWLLLLLYPVHVLIVTAAHVNHL